MGVRLIDELTLQRELFCQIQQNAIGSGSIHYDNYKNWCLSGLEVEKAINDIFSKSGPFAPTIDPETLPIVQELREKLMLTEANQQHFKEERDEFEFKMREVANAANAEIDRRNKTIAELRERLEQVTKERDEARRDCAVAESNHSECLAQLAKARVQLKSAVTDMEALMWHSGDGCNICRHCVEVHREPYVRLDCGLGSGCECKPEWRGPDGDHP